MGAKMRLSVRIAAMLLLVLSFGVGLTAFLSQAKFERTLEDLVRSRLQVVALDLANAVEGALGLGLAIEEASNIPDALAAEAAADSEILWIGVRAPDGRAIFETGAAPDAAAGLTVTAPVTNAFGREAGQVAVVGSRAAIGPVVAETLRRLGFAAVAAVLMATGIGALLAGLALKGIVGHFTEARRAVEAMQRGRTPEVASAPDDAPAIDRDFTDFRRLARQAFVDLYRAEQAADEAPARDRGPEG